MVSIGELIGLFVLIIVLLNISITLLTEKKKTPPEDEKERVEWRKENTEKLIRRWIAILILAVVTLLANVLSGIVSGFFTNRIEESYKGQSIGVVEGSENPAVDYSGISHGGGIGWGDNGGGRPSYSRAQVNTNILGTRVLLNSISNGANGNEKNFLSIKEVGTDEWFSGDVFVEEGKEYYLRFYVANDSLSFDAKGVRSTLAIQKDVGKQITMTGYINSTNAAPSELWCDIRLNADRAFYINIISGSGILKTDKIQTMLSDQIITSSGVLIGYDKLDGMLPGSKDAYVIIKVKPFFVE